MKHSEVFAKTIKFFKHHKWGRGHFKNEETDAYCLIGAMNKVQKSQNIDPQSETSPAQIYFEKKLGLTDAIEFNDAMLTKRKDVIAALQIAHDCAVAEGK